jgi:hypothetical protein
LNKQLIAVACFSACTAFAQLGGGYLGPAVLSSGASGVGNRSGQQVDLRFFAGVNGTYDSSQQPVSLDSKGNLTTVSGLAGVELNVGVYGTHNWRTSLLGVDYRGVFREYVGGSQYDGIDQNLTLGYTLQESRRLRFDGRLTGGIVNNGLGGIGFAPNYTSNDVVQPASILFDNRSYYVQGGLNATYIFTPRTSFTFGGQGFEVWRQSSQLVGVEGYNATGSIEHRLSKFSSVGFTYQRQHFDFPKAFGKADIDTGQLFFGTTFDRNWTIVVKAGVFHSEVSGLQSVTLSPVIAALLGQTSTIQSFYLESISPSGSATLTRRFKTASLAFGYEKATSPGNGVYLTSKTENGSASYSYTGIRKASIGVSGGYYSLSSLGQGIQPYRSANAGAGFTYTLPYSLHFVARYDYRYQAIENLTYKHTGYRATIGISFSPGNVPLSLW